MLARETALARVCAIEKLDVAQQSRLQALATRAAQHLAEWKVPDADHQLRISQLREDWERLYPTFDFTEHRPLDRVMNNIKSHTADVQELTAALKIEPFGDLVDGLTECMADPGFGPGPVPCDTGALRSAIEQHFAWALTPDYEDHDCCGQFWYVSEAKQEPRLGRRFEEAGAELESPLDIGRRVKALYRDLPVQNIRTSSLLQTYPDHALAVSRVQLAAQHPYAEIRDNLIAATCLPIDMLRCKLSFFGASKFDPKSDRWTRITLCQGAPLADELDRDADDWWLPVFAQGPVL